MPQQPREFDAVLSNSLPPKVGAVLGGIEGVKNRFNSPIAEVRIAALNNALNYGEPGIDLIIQRLQDVEAVQLYAIRLLLHFGGAKGKQALLNYHPKLFFTTLQHWDIQNYNPQLSITHTAYNIILNRMTANKPDKFDLSQLQSFLQATQTTQIEALACKMWDDYWQHDTQYRDFENVLCGACDKLPNLKALFIGDGDAQEANYMKSRLLLSDSTSILTKYPNLEVLQFRGGWGLQFDKVRHEHLKTLMIQTGYTIVQPQTINDISNLDLPALEYLEIWLAESFHYGQDISTQRLAPILSGELFPSLKYLGLKSSNYSDNIAFSIVNSPLLQRLAVLDLSQGTLTDFGAETLLKCPAINQLHTLNVSMNKLSARMVQKLSRLHCRVMTQPQDNGERQPAP
ncbi:leucine rich repeat variant [Calothrix sp. NIES-4071]|nr:leucine rich repeat variant [Calothrix sp. NIES-4071]BAZ59940.1 leucine rich repeat variant [Calothrix sp. NIES-4105]